MKIFKTMICNDKDGQILICDTISYGGKLWLVPFWYENIIEKYKSPARIIRMDNLKYQKMPPSAKFPADYLINDPLPKVVLDHLSPIPKDTSLEILDAPDIRIPIRSQDYDA